MVKLYGSDGVRGLLYGDFSQFIMQLIDAGTVAIFGFVMAYVWFKVSDPSRRFASAKKPRSKVLMVRRWVSWVIRTSNFIRDRGLWNSNTESRISHECGSHQSMVNFDETTQLTPLTSI